MSSFASTISIFLPEKPCTFCTELFGSPQTLTHYIQKLYVESTALRVPKRVKCHCKIRVGVTNQKLAKTILKLKRFSLDIVGRDRSKEAFMGQLLYHAFEKQDVQAVELLLNQGATFEYPCFPYQRTPLFYAVHAKKETVALKLLGMGVACDSVDSLDIPLINMAVRAGLFQVVEELMRRGIKPTTVDTIGWTCLHDAAFRDNSLITNCLLKNGALIHIDARSIEFWTPLYSAVYKGYIDNVRMLVESGADLSLKYDGLDIVQVAEATLQFQKNIHFLPEEEWLDKLEKHEAIVAYLKKNFV